MPNKFCYNISLQFHDMSVEKPTIRKEYVIITQSGLMIECVYDLVHEKFNYYMDENGNEKYINAIFWAEKSHKLERLKSEAYDRTHK